MPQPNSAPIPRRSHASRSCANRPYSLPIPAAAALILFALAAAGSPAGPPAVRSTLYSSDAAASPAAIPAASPAASPAPAQKARKAAPEPSTSPEALALVEKMAERAASYPKLESWQARALSTSSRMTSEWKPKSTTTSEKIVKMDGPYWSEEILSATETEDGRTRDVTAKMREEARERAAKQRRSSADEREADQRSRGRRGLDMARDELFPFGPDKRSGYDFAIEGPAELDGAPVVLLRSRSLVRSDKKFEGLYFVDAATYDVRRVEMTLAKRPAPLKRMEMEIDFTVLPEGHHMMAKAVMRIHVGIVVKNIRVEAVETYSDFKIGDTIPIPHFPGLHR